MAEERADSAFEDPDCQENGTGIYLGFPLDHLLNRRGKLIGPSKPAISVPTGQEPGTGNIVIWGPPGSGKSTLALQMACVCAARKDNGFVSAYISLEEGLRGIQAKAKTYGWLDWVRPLRFMQHGSIDEASPERLGVALRSILTQPEHCPILSDLGREPSELEESGGDTPCAQHDKRREGRLEPRVLLPSLSPRHLTDDLSGEQLFWRRCEQIELLLRASDHLQQSIAKKENEDEPEAILPLVAIDSLNMLTGRELNRDQIYHLFDIFRRYNRVGVFVVESTEPTFFDSTMADVVIALSSHKDHGYFVRYLEIEKSRHVPQVYGWHPFKTVGHRKSGITPLVQQLGLRRNACAPEGPLAPGKKDMTTGQTSESDEQEGEKARSGVVVFPSIHYVVSKTEAPTPTADPTEERFSDIWGIDALKRVLPENLARGSVVMIEGPAGTFKTNFACTFLANGLRKGTEEAGLLLNLQDQPLLDREPDIRRWPTLGSEVAGEFSWRELAYCLENELGDGKAKWQNLAEIQKARISLWKRDYSDGLSRGQTNLWSQEYLDALSENIDKGQTHFWTLERLGSREDDRVDDLARPSLIEVDFKTGALLPEEFVQIMRDIIIRFKEVSPIRRVVLDDVGAIGASYPFLKKSRTAGDLFLSALVHIVRNHGMDLVMTGTTGDLAVANESVSRASALADAVISCRFRDIFGDRHVIVQGEGLMAGRGTQAETIGESVPPVVRLTETDDGRTAFQVDSEYLEGLVGFESGEIKRPGVVVHLFEENQAIHARYNQEMESMLEAAMAHPSRLARASSSGGYLESDRTSVSLITFDSTKSEAFHDSLDVFGAGAPLEKTVLCTVDEFGREKKTRGHFLELIPAADAGEDDGDENLLNPEELVGHMQHSEVEEGQEKNWRLWPYYLNLLVLAYRKELFEQPDRRGEARIDWKNKPPKKWQEIAGAAKQVEPDDSLLCVVKESPIGRSFWFDQSARETLSCVLLDALASGKGLHESTPQETGGILEDFESGGKDELSPKGEVMGELCAVHELLHRVQQEGVAVEKGKGMPGDSALYVCWYSQLRELIQFNPELREKIGVCPLPGNGFRGDWFIGIVKGSVSLTLGRKIIEILCSRDEEYKRFARGVGLPVREEFYDEKEDFFAWLGGVDTVHVSKLRDMHEKARSRSHIKGYESLRSTIYTVAKQLTPEWGPRLEDKERRRKIRDIVSRLPKQVEMLHPTEE